MGNCVGQRRLKSDGSLKKNVPNTPSKENEGKESAANGKQTKLDKTASEDNVNKGKIMTQKDDNLNNSEKSCEEKSQGDSWIENKESGAEDNLETNEKDSANDILTTSWVVFDDDETSKPDKATEKALESGEKRESKNENVAVETATGESSCTNHDKVSEAEKQPINIKTEKITAPARGGKSQSETTVQVKSQKSGESEGGKTPIKPNEGPKKDTSLDSVTVDVKKPKKAGIAAKIGKNVDSEKSELESTNILHEVKDGRVIANGGRVEEKVKVGRVVKGNDETEKLPQEKKADVLRKKMEVYARFLKADDNIIDFEKHLFVEELLNQNVLLEEIQISGREINGLVAVTCKREPSKVLVRFTTDSWKSKKEEEAVPFKHSQDGTYQRFFFSIFVPWAKSVLFAVEAVTEDGMLWDNNNCNNYFVENVKNGNEPGKLVAQFSTQKLVLFADYVKAKAVCLKNASVHDGKAHLNISVRKGSRDPPGVRYTLNNWETFSDVVCLQFKEDGEDDQNHHNFHADFEVKKAAKLVFVIFWKHDGTEDWDNNNGKNYEIQLP